VRCKIPTIPIQIDPASFHFIAEWESGISPSLLHVLFRCPENVKLVVFTLVVNGLNRQTIAPSRTVKLVVFTLVVNGLNRQTIAHSRTNAV
jgi:hypothetical protein